MLNRRDLQARIRRLDQLIQGLNIELVQLAVGREPLTKEERRAYCTAIEDMVNAARAAVTTLQAAVDRLTREEAKGCRCCPASAWQQPDQLLPR